MESLLILVFLAIIGLVFDYLERRKKQKEIEYYKPYRDSLLSCKKKFIDDFIVKYPFLKDILLDTNYLNYHPKYVRNTNKHIDKIITNYINLKISNKEFETYIIKCLLEIKEEINKRIEFELNREERSSRKAQKQELHNKIKQKILSEQEAIKDKWGEYLAKYKYPSKYNIHLKPQELGKRYERYIGYLYEVDDYKVDFHGIIKGKADRGIDIVAKKKKEIIIIQCKRYGKDTLVRENTIQQLKGVLDTEKRKNLDKNVIARLYTANDNLDEFAQEELAHSEIEHIIEPYDDEYPLIKCNIGKDGEKIYHLPGIGMYDRIKIEYSKNECYVQTEEEAKNLGFRKSI